MIWELELSLAEKMGRGDGYEGELNHRTQAGVAGTSSTEAS